MDVCVNRKKEITGASFTLHPMSDDFARIIKESLNKTDTSNVWMETDDVTTTIRGDVVHVFDVTQAIVYYAAQTGQHISFHVTYSYGCPGDSEADTYLGANDTPTNVNNIKVDKQYAAAKFSLYPLKNESYMDVIYQQIELMKEYVDVTPVHYATKLEGDLLRIFTGLEKVFTATIHQGSTHTVMTADFSVNSPSHE